MSKKYGNNLLVYNIADLGPGHLKNTFIIIFLKKNIAFVYVLIANISVLHIFTMRL